MAKPIEPGALVMIIADWPGGHGKNIGVCGTIVRRVVKDDLIIELGSNAFAAVDGWLIKGGFWLPKTQDYTYPYAIRDNPQLIRIDDYEPEVFFNVEVTIAGKKIEPCSIEDLTFDSSK